MQGRTFIILLLSITAFGSLANDRSRVDALHERSYQYLDADIDSSYALATHALELAEDIDYKWGISNSYYIQGYVFQLKQELSKSLIFYLKAIKTLEYLPDGRSIRTHVDLLLNCGNILRQHYKYQESLDFYNDAMKLAQAHKLNQRISKILYNKSVAFQYLSELNEAALSARESLERALENSDEYMILNALNQLGLIHKDMGHLEAAREYYRKIIDYDYQGPDPSKHIGRTYHNMAVTFLAEEDFENAAHYFLIALQEKKKRSRPDRMFVTLLDLTELYLKTEDLETAQYYGLMAKNFYENVTLSADHYKLFDYLNKIMYGLGKYEDAQKYAQMYVSESEEFNREQHEVIRLREQFKIELVLTGYYQEVKSNHAILTLQRALLLCVVLGLTIATIRLQYRKLIKKQLERGLRALRDS